MGKKSKKKARSGSELAGGSDVLVIEDAIKIFKSGKVETVALRGLYATFHRGEISVIMGPSGCGKTTLLNMIGGLGRLSSGRIIVDGENIEDYTDSELEEYRREKVGIVFQFMNLIPELSAAENIRLPSELAGRPVSKERVSELLAMVGLSEKAEQRPETLSGGEQQRVAFAAALANDARIILCDEPTGELDSESKLRVLNLIKRLRDEYPEKFIIIVTHDPEFKKIADRLFYIRDGVISHEFDRAAIEEDLKRFGAGGESLDVKGIDGTGTEMAIRELREVVHKIQSRISELERQVHPI